MEIQYAATGLAGAWLINQFAGFRLVTLYLPKPPTDEALDRIGFREEARGANVWLVVPNDPGVYWASRVRYGVQCVHPVQVYLDLAAQPERAAETADRLRAQITEAWERLYA